MTKIIRKVIPLCCPKNCIIFQEEIKEITSKDKIDTVLGKPVDKMTFKKCYYHDSVYHRDV